MLTSMLQIRKPFVDASGTRAPKQYKSDTHCNLKTCASQNSNRSTNAAIHQVTIRNVRSRGMIAIWRLPEFGVSELLRQLTGAEEFHLESNYGDLKSG